MSGFQLTVSVALCFIGLLCLLMYAELRKVVLMGTYLLSTSEKDHKQNESNSSHNDDPSLFRRRNPVVRAWVRVLDNLVHHSHCDKRDKQGRDEMHQRFVSHFSGCVRTLL
jgi:hypothetical protein